MAVFGNCKHPEQPTQNNDSEPGTRAKPKPDNRAGARNRSRGLCKFHSIICECECAYRARIQVQRLEILERENITESPSCASRAPSAWKILGGLGSIARTNRRKKGKVTHDV